MLRMEMITPTCVREVINLKTFNSHREYISVFTRIVL